MKDDPNKTVIFSWYSEIKDDKPDDEAQDDDLLANLFGGQPISYRRTSNTEYMGVFDSDNRGMIKHRTKADIVRGVERATSIVKIGEAFRFENRYIIIFPALDNTYLMHIIDENMYQKIAINANEYLPIDRPNLRIKKVMREAIYLG